MEFRLLEITGMHAKDLKKVNLMSKMDVYAVVSISGDPHGKQRTAVDKDGGTSPRWKELGLRFNVDAAAADQNRLTLGFLLRSDRVLGDRDIGEARVPVKELLENLGGEKVKAVTYPVLTPSGKPHGSIAFSYRIGEKFAAPVPPGPAPAEAPKAGGEPVLSYPANPGYPPPPHAAYPPQHPYPAGYAPPPPGGYGYPPPQPGYGYPLPQQGYGYAPPPAGPGYGYPPVQQQAAPAKNKSKLGLGMGMGLGAGLLGGLLVGEMASDVGEMASYDDGYDF